MHESMKADAAKVEAGQVWNFGGERILIGENTLSGGVVAKTEHGKTRFIPRHDILRSGVLVCPAELRVGDVLEWPGGAFRMEIVGEGTRRSCFERGCRIVERGPAPNVVDVRPARAWACCPFCDRTVVLEIDAPAKRCACDAATALRRHEGALQANFVWCGKARSVPVDLEGPGAVVSDICERQRHRNDVEQRSAEQAMRQEKRRIARERLARTRAEGERFAWAINGRSREMRARVPHTLRALADRVERGSVAGLSVTQAHAAARALRRLGDAVRASHEAGWPAWGVGRRHGWDAIAEVGICESQGALHGDLLVCSLERQADDAARIVREGAGKRRAMIGHLTERAPRGIDP